MLRLPTQAASMGVGPGWCLVAIAVSGEGTQRAGQAQPQAGSLRSCLSSWLPSLRVWCLWVRCLFSVNR